MPSECVRHRARQIETSVVAPIHFQRVNLSGPSIAQVTGESQWQNRTPSKPIFQYSGSQEPQTRCTPSHGNLTTELSLVEEGIKDFSDRYFGFLDITTEKAWPELLQRATESFEKDKVADECYWNDRIAVPTSRDTLDLIDPPGRAHRRMVELTGEWN